MRARLILAIFSTLLEETAIVVIVFWGLPQIGIKIPLLGLLALMVLWGSWAIIAHRLGSRALRRKQLAGLPNMVGCQGTVVRSLAPVGLVRIRGELWVAKSASGEMVPGEEVTVVKQARLKLVVRSSNSASDLERAE